ncbi:MAG: hypothetical protein R3E08_01620 [Thiotrichaceae bacterium]
MSCLGRLLNWICPRIESLEVQLFHPDTIPGDELAFPVIRRTLTHYCDDLATAPISIAYQ